MSLAALRCLQAPLVERRWLWQVACNLGQLQGTLFHTQKHKKYSFFVLLASAEHLVESQNSCMSSEAGTCRGSIAAYCSPAHIMDTTTTTTTTAAAATATATATATTITIIIITTIINDRRSVKDATLACGERKNHNSGRRKAFSRFLNIPGGALHSRSTYARLLRKQLKVEWWQEARICIHRPGRAR